MITDANNDEPESVSSRDASPGGRERFPKWKRCLDLTLVCLSCPVWSVLFLLIGAWIWAASRGPFFYRQTRVGYGGRRFVMIKFRSMAIDADHGKHDAHVRRLIDSGKPLTKLDAVGDSRLIPGGAFLRSSGLDELPQIINVIRREMSLVGPRPCTLVEFDHYEPAQKERFHSPPGITGYWQVNGKNQTTFEQMISMDIHYTREMSPLLDLKIIAKTLPAILRQMSGLLPRRERARDASFQDNLSAASQRCQPDFRLRPDFKKTTPLLDNSTK